MSGVRFPLHVNDPILVLLDIDGTLLDAAGQGREAFHEALDSFYPGRTFPLVSMAGRTDRGLWEQFTALVPQDPPSFDAFLERYVAILDRRLGGHPPLALPGAQALVHALETEPDFHPGLVTGNIEEGSRLKLHHCGLWEVFERTGLKPAAFGDVDPDKGPLADKALAQWGTPARAIVVGDTPEDIRCAHLAGIPCLAVVHGHFSETQLREAGADAIVPNLSDTPRVLGLIRELARHPQETAS